MTDPTPVPPIPNPTRSPTRNPARRSPNPDRSRTPNPVRRSPNPDRSRTRNPARRSPNRDRAVSAPSPIRHRPTRSADARAVAADPRSAAGAGSAGPPTAAADPVGLIGMPSERSRRQPARTIVQ